MISIVDSSFANFSKEFLNLLHCIDIKPHVTHPSHNRGHALDLVITYGLATDLAVSDHFCVFFNIISFSQQEAPVRTIRKCYLTSEVAANFIEILPAPCDFIIHDFNNKLKSTPDSVAPLLTETIKTKHTTRGQMSKLKKM